MGGWAVAQSPILLTTITLERLHKRGYEAMLTLYEKIAPHLNEPLYMCLSDIMFGEHLSRKAGAQPAYVQWCERLCLSVYPVGQPIRLALRALLFCAIVSYFSSII